MLLHSLEKCVLWSRNPCLMVSLDKKCVLRLWEFWDTREFSYLYCNKRERAIVRHIQHTWLKRNDASDVAMPSRVTHFRAVRPTILWESRMRYYPPFRQPRTKEALLNGTKNLSPDGNWAVSYRDYPRKSSCFSIDGLTLEVDCRRHSCAGFCGFSGGAHCRISGLSMPIQSEGNPV